MNLEYNVPYLGKINAKLFDESNNCYFLLDKYDHIERMKEIDQLGVIRGVYEGAHHSRWEYVMVQLSIIHQLCTLKDEETGRNIANGLGLKSNSKFLDYEISGASILQIWILLFNSGHLPGTFASERAILENCIDNSNFRRIFRNGLPEGYFRGLFDETIEKEDVYNIHKLLICFHLNRYRRFNRFDKGGSKFIDFLLNVMYYYFEPPQENLERQENLKKIFRTIRQLSYLFLDSQYASFPLNFDLSMIFLNFPVYIDELFKFRNSSILTTLNSFEDLLSMNMYHSSTSISGLGVHEERVKLLLNEVGINSIVKFNELLKDPQKSNIFNPDFRFICDNREILHLLFEINNSLPLINDYAYRKFRNILNYEFEQKLNSKYGKSNCILTFQPANISNHFAITLTMREHQIKSNMGIIGKFLKDMINLSYRIKEKENSFIKSIIDEIFLNPYEGLFLSILKYITSETLYFEFKDRKISKSILPTKRSLRSIPKEIDTVIKNSRLSGSRLEEIRSLESSILDLNHRSGNLASLSPIQVYNQYRESVTDIDGAVLEFKDGKLGILLVEAKNLMHRSFSTAETQLKNNIENMGFKTDEEVEMNRLSSEDGGKCVYCYLPINGNIEQDQY
jgi:hypothetical protein